MLEPWLTPQNQCLFGGCSLTLQFSAVRWWESNTHPAEAGLGMSLFWAASTPHDTSVDGHGGTRARPSQGTTRPGCGGLSRTQPVEAEAPVLSDGKGHAAKGGRQPRRPSKETALRGGKADLLAAVGLLVFKGDYFFFTEKDGTATACNCHFPSSLLWKCLFKQGTTRSTAVCSTGLCEGRGGTATGEDAAFLRK